MKVGDSREYSYYCPDKKVWEETGYIKGATDRRLAQYMN